jgi:hypothetical protein
VTPGGDSDLDRGAARPPGAPRWLRPATAPPGTAGRGNVAAGDRGPAGREATADLERDDPTDLERDEAAGLDRDEASRWPSWLVGRGSADRLSRHSLLVGRGSDGRLSRHSLLVGRGSDGRLSRHSLLVAAAALVAGFVAGFLLPATRREDEMLGDARDHLVDGARAAGRAIADTGREVAARVVHDAVATVRDAEDDLVRSFGGSRFDPRRPEPPASHFM